MALALADHWLWDHWILTSDDHLDLFFLRASKALLTTLLPVGDGLLISVRQT